MMHLPASSLFPQPICAPRDHGAVGEKWITNEKLPLWNERKTHCLNFLVFQVLSDLSQMRRRNENMKLFPNMNLNQPMAMLLTLNHSSQLFRDLELCFLSAYHHPVSFSLPPSTFRERKHFMCKETKRFVLLTCKIVLWLLFVYAVAYQGLFSFCWHCETGKRLRLNLSSGWLGTDRHVTPLTRHRLSTTPPRIICVPSAIHICLIKQHSYQC